MAEMTLIEVDVNDLIPYENNPRKNEKAVAAVAASIREFGFLRPIIVDENYVIISGHTRRLAALELGLKTVPVHVAHDMSEAQARAYRVIDNRIAELATWDADKLQEEIAQIVGLDLSAFGFSDKMLQEAFEEDPDARPHVCPRCGCEFMG